MLYWYDEIQKIKSWIDRNIEEDISLSQLSDYCGYSPHYLSKKFHELGLESGTYNPSLDFLVKVAKGLGKEVQIILK